MNTDFVQSIKKGKILVKGGIGYEIKFYQREGNEVSFRFDTADELDDCYDALMNFIGARSTRSSYIKI